LGGGGSSPPAASKIIGDVAPKPGPAANVDPSTPKWILGTAAGMRRRTNRAPKTAVLKKKFPALMKHLANAFSICFVYIRCVRVGEDSNFLLHTNQVRKYRMSQKLWHSVYIFFPGSWKECAWRCLHFSEPQTSPLRGALKFIHFATNSINLDVISQVSHTGADRFPRITLKFLLLFETAGTVSPP
jgi:hypothetical protein